MLENPSLFAIGTHGADPVLDVVFIHGLGGDATSTWTSPAGSWPAWVAQSNPSVRVFCLNYNAQLSIFRNGTPNTVLAELCINAFFQTGIGSRPFILIGHSTGGLLAKEIIRISTSRNQDSLGTRCVGLVLLATPASPLRLPFSSLTKSLFRSLPNDSYIEDLTAWYSQNGASRISTISFFAMRDSIISPASHGQDVLLIPIDTSHAEISKPPSPRANIVTKLQDFIAKTRHKYKLPSSYDFESTSNFIAQSRPLSNGSWYQSQKQSLAIVFVHGFLSDSASCWWDRTTGSYWPELILSDWRTAKADIFLGGYYTAVDSGAYNIRNAADELYRSLRRKDLLNQPPVMTYGKIVFVAHSLGGVVIRHLLNANREQFKEKKVGVLLYASPSFGSKQADRVSLLRRYFQNEVGHQLVWGGETLKELDNSFKELLQRQLIPNLRGAEAIENHFIIRRKWLPFLRRTLIVTEESASRYFGEGRIMPNTDRFSIVKPNNHDHPSHLFLVDFLCDNGFDAERPSGVSVAA